MKGFLEHGDSVGFGVGRTTAAVLNRPQFRTDPHQVFQYLYVKNSLNAEIQQSDWPVTVPPPDIGNRVKTATAIAVAIHNVRIAVFCYAQRSSSAEETNRVQTAVCLFSSRFALGLNFSYSYSAVLLRNIFPVIFNLFQSFNPQKPSYLDLVKSRII